MLSLVIGTLGIQFTKAQQVQRTWLLSTTCVDTVSYRWGKEQQEVSIGREVYTSSAYMWPGSGFSCKLNPASRFQTLKLGFGLLDNSNMLEGLVRVYLNGNKAVDRTFPRGKAETVLLDVKNISSVAIEFYCTSNNCPEDRLRIFQATLESPLRSPGAR